VLCCKLAQWGPGGAPTARACLAYFEAWKRDCMVVTIFCFFCADKMSVKTGKTHVFNCNFPTGFRWLGLHVSFLLHIE